MNPILTVLPFHQGDAPQALRLLKWIQSLDYSKNNNPPKRRSILLAADSKTSLDICKEIGAKAREHYKHVIPLSLRIEPTGVAGANAMFHAITKWVKDSSRLPFLWLEPDCVPIRNDWMDELEKQYAIAPTGYMGTLVPAAQEGLPAMHMPGCSVYPQNAHDFMAEFCTPRVQLAWDMGAADSLIKKQMVTKTDAIQSLWGEVGNPPVFISERKQGAVYPSNTMDINFIKMETVLFHRCKDDSLINILSAKYKIK